ncbi:MAG TPA: hypothetical protein VFW88_06825 [Burkholderiales bacterium]|nr:hypothetical protein [Burkholderiales bacterium]
MNAQPIHVCRTSLDVERCCSALKRLPIPPQGIDVYVRRHKVKRSNPQNARLWWLHGLMAAHLNERLPQLIEAQMISPLFTRFTPEAVHEGIFKPRYCGTNPDGSVRSSARMSKLDFMTAMERYEADMVTDGVEIPEPPEWLEDAA